MQGKLFLRIVCCASLALFIRSDVGAFGFFSKTSEPSAEQAKSLYDNSIKNLEESKTECHDLFGELDSILPEIENVRAEFKLCLEKLEEQVQKLNEAYASWEALGYPIRGAEYEAYTCAKDEFEKATAVYRLEKEIFKSYCKKLELLFGRDAKVLSAYESDLNNSISLYYNYGMVLAKNDSKRI